MGWVWIKAIANLAGWTPLHVAAEGGREAVVEVLLRHKADCSLVTDTGLDDHDDHELHQRQMMMLNLEWRWASESKLESGSCLTSY